MYTKYEQALNFMYASQRCLMDLRQEDVRILPIPYMVNSAFACELFLKAVLEENNVNYGRIHLLKDLFDLLPKKIKKEIESSVDDEEFSSKLTASSNTFVNFRYIFEDINKVAKVNLEFWEKFVAAIYLYCKNNLKKGENIHVEL